MPARSITFVRHGHREDFLGDGFDLSWSKTAEYPNDPDLSALGILEASALGAALASSSLTVLCSPFLRTVHTASLIAAAAGTKVHIEPGLHEFLTPQFFPDLPKIRTPAELQTRFADLDLTYRPKFGFNFPEQGFGGLVERTGRVLPTFRDESEGDVVAVTHADPLEAFLMAADIDSFRIPIRTCAIYRIEDRDGRWRLTVDGEVGHLIGLKPPG